MHNKTLLFAGVKQSNLAATLKNGLRLPHKESPALPYPYGHGIYLTDCFSKAALASMASKEPQRVCVVLVEAALGDMHKAQVPKQFERPPKNCHSVYGVGTMKPEPRGIRDMQQDNFKPRQETAATPKALFLHSGRMAPNADCEGVGVAKQCNDYVLYDEAQVAVRYLIDCEVRLE